jgi:spore coat polysaccharide biosynthesis predicted glycosyltransferase SpsG
LVQIQEPLYGIKRKKKKEKRKKIREKKRIEFSLDRSNILCYSQCELIVFNVGDLMWEILLIVAFWVLVIVLCMTDSGSNGR